MSSGQKGWHEGPHLVKICQVFELTKTGTQNGGIGIGTAGECDCDCTGTFPCGRKHEQVGFLNDLVVVSCFPVRVVKHTHRTSEIIPESRIEWCQAGKPVGKFEPEIQISSPPVVRSRLGFVLSITASGPPIVSSSLAAVAAWRDWRDGIGASAGDGRLWLSAGGAETSLVLDGTLLVGPLESPDESPAMALN